MPERIRYVFLRWNVSIPDADFSRHPARLTSPAEKGHQGIIGDCSLWLKDCNKITMRNINHLWGNEPQFRFLKCWEHPTFMKSLYFIRVKLLKTWQSSCMRLTASPVTQASILESLEYAIIIHMSNLPEYRRSASYESSGLLSLLAHNPSSSSLHIYLLCSSSMPVDRRNQEHLHNRSVFQCVSMNKH